MSDGQPEHRADSHELLHRIRRLKEWAAKLDASQREPIAIVGIGCRLPGGVTDPDTFWQLLDAGRDVVGPIPASRWDMSVFFDPDPSAAGKAYVREAAFVEGVDQFDPQFFGISPREAQRIDPQQRLLLETTWHAFEHAAIPPDSLQGSRTGIFVGVGPSDYQTLMEPMGWAERTDAYSATGTHTSFAAGRLSYHLGLQGPSLAVDTACSSSLAAIHLACQSLRTGDCDVAVAGAVQLMLSPLAFVSLSRLRALAPDGRCKTFSAEANGYGRGEGCVMFVLKRIADATEAGDRIAALIKGSAVNHDGRSGGLTVPNGNAQRAVILQALKNARLQPQDIDYVEAHGTGTPLGDPIEVSALATAFRPDRQSTRALRIGAVKTNIGHLESAAGAAGALKVILAMQRERIPPHLHAHNLSPHIDWASLPIQVTTDGSPWPKSETPRRAGVSAFGISGTNGHLILEEAPPSPPKPVIDARNLRPASLLPLSARTPEALREMAQRYAQHLEEHGEQSLEDVCFAAAIGRTHFEERLAVVAATRQEAIARLRDFDVLTSPANGSRPLTVAFVFPGQGGQWLGMGKELLSSSAAFRQEIDACATAMEPFIDWQLLNVMAGSCDASLFERVDVIQPALFAMQAGLAALWRSWGIRPSAVVGHSMGEVAAAYIAGALSLTDACRVICLRSRLVRQAGRQGAMVAVSLSADEAQRAIAGLEADVALGVLNSPHSTVLSGARGALEEIVEGLQARGVDSKWVKVDYASHSPQMEPLLPELVLQLSSIRPLSNPGVPLFSTVTGRRHEQPLDAAYWATNLRQPVRFIDATKALAEDGINTFLEINAHPTLLPAIEETVSGITVAATLRRDQPPWPVLLQQLGKLYVAGAAVDWKAVCLPGHRVTLPAYPFQRQRCWIETEASPTQLPSGAPGAFALSGFALQVPGEVLHQIVPVDPARQSYLADHVVFGNVIVPGAFHVAVLLSVAADRLGATSVTLQDLQFERALVLNDAVNLHVLLQSGEDGSYAVSIHSAAGRHEDESRWQVHASGTLRLGAPSSRRETLADARQACAQPVDISDFFERLANLQIAWGPQWRWLHKAAIADGGALVSLMMPDGVKSETHTLHPTLLDNGFSAGTIGMTRTSADAIPHLPWFLKELRWYGGEAGDPVWAHGMRKSVSEESIVSDLTFFDGVGRVVASVDGFVLKRAPRHAFLAMATGEPSSLFALRWEPQPLTAAGAAIPRTGTWLVLTDGEISSTPWIQSLRSSGVNVRLAKSDPEVALQPLLRDVTAVVCWWPMMAVESEAVAAESRTLSGLQVVRALAAFGQPVPRLWWVTEGAQGVDHSDAHGRMSLSASSLWGLGRVIMQEHPELRCTLVDAAPGEAENVLREFAAASDESQVSWRAGSRFVARLGRAAPRREAEAAPGFSSQSTILITGGLGTLGLHCARWLVKEHRISHLALVGRNGAHTPAQQQAVKALEDAGVRVTVLAADISDRAQVQALLSAIPPELPLRGVVHTAGVLEDATLAQQNAASVARVFAAKVHGAWHLHELTKDLPLAHFIMYSSAAALFGNPGQGNYAAANAFLDALAHHRRSQGLPALSLNWGLWAGAGMGDNLAAAHRSRFTRQGMRLISSELGELLLEDALVRNDIQLVPLPLDFSMLRQTLTASGVPPLWRALVKADSSQVAPKGALANRLAVLSAEAREQEVTALVHREVGRVLGLRDVPADRPFKELGLDSLMAIEFRNGLASKIGQPLRATLAFDFPSLNRVTQHILSLLPSADGVAMPVAAGEDGQQTSFLRLPVGDDPFRVEMDQPGSLDGLVLRRLERRAPAVGEVEIAIEAAGLNFHDVLEAMGLLPSLEEARPVLGGECAGRIVAVGHGVSGLSPGQAVVAMAPNVFASHVTAAETLVLPIPEGLTMEQAATLPVAHMTAVYALDHVARLARGERLLIHSATGGVGHAAIQWARHVGAEIFATAGSQEKREALRALGIEHVSDSRSIQFTEDIRSWTGGEGVDVVLNSLSGELLEAGFDLLRDHGRFVEIGKRDYLANAPLGLKPFLRSLMFALVDLADMANKRPEQVRRILQEVLAHVANGVLSPIPHHVISVGRIDQAFRAMAQAKHQGKCIISMTERVRFSSDDTCLPRYQSVFGEDIRTGLVHISAENDVEIGIHGDGPPVVFVPPLGCEFVAWEPVLSRLPGYRKIAINLPGYGRSRSAEVDLQSHVERIRLTLAALGVEFPVRMIGWSLGGMIAQQFALSYPESTASLVLVNSASFLSPCETAEDIADLRRRFAEAQQHSIDLHPQPELACARLFFGAEMRNPGAFTKLWVASSGVDLRPDVQAITAPALVIAGDVDQIIPVAASRETSDLIPGARYVEFAGQGHYIPLVQPDAFVAQVTAHWNR